MIESTDHQWALAVVVLRMPGVFEASPIVVIISEAANGIERHDVHDAMVRQWQLWKRLKSDRFDHSR